MIILNLLVNNMKKILSIVFMISFSKIANKTIIEFLPENYQGANIEKVEQIIVYVQYVFYFLAILMALDIVWRIYSIYRNRFSKDNV